MNKKMLVISASCIVLPHVMFRFVNSVMPILNEMADTTIKMIHTAKTLV